MKFCTINVFKVTVRVKCSNYGICNCSETTLQRGYGVCENVYIFRAKYCCKDVSWLAAAALQLGPEMMSVQNGGAR